LELLENSELPKAMLTGAAYNFLSGALPNTDDWFEADIERAVVSLLDKDVVKEPNF
jgi:hypothetical protein